MSAGMTAITVVSILLNVVLLYSLLIVWSGRAYFRAMREGEDPEPTDRRPRFRRFAVHRDVDVTGISGTGIPVEGVVFSDGWGVTHWLDRAPMHEPKTEVWHNPGVGPFIKISGHNGATRVVWLDEA